MDLKIRKLERLAAIGDINAKKKLGRWQARIGAYSVHVLHLMNVYADTSAEEFNAEQEVHAKEWDGYIEWSEWCEWRGGLPAYDWFTGKISPYFNGSSLDARCKVCRTYECRHENELMSWYADYFADEIELQRKHSGLEGQVAIASWRLRPLSILVTLSL